MARSKNTGEAAGPVDIGYETEPGGGYPPLDDNAAGGFPMPADGYRDGETLEQPHAGPVTKTRSGRPVALDDAEDASPDA